MKKQTANHPFVFGYELWYAIVTFSSLALPFPWSETPTTKQLCSICFQESTKFNTLDCLFHFDIKYWSNTDQNSMRYQILCQSWSIDFNKVRSWREKEVIGWGAIKRFPQCWLSWRVGYMALCFEHKWGEESLGNSSESGGGGGGGEHQIDWLGTFFWWKKVDKDKVKVDKRMVLVNISSRKRRGNQWFFL